MAKYKPDNIFSVLQFKNTQCIDSYLIRESHQAIEFKKIYSDFHSFIQNIFNSIENDISALWMVLKEKGHWRPFVINVLDAYKTTFKYSSFIWYYFDIDK